ncbi:AAA family ATPase [uncultured Ramlibacter sp.]|uniref:ATP-binding protein n=1 Tax=uncultured Ramlibacter sp. TaxID=260755 RepID=UPI00262DF644|nr:AAA family ATPase [uncultured Ramlibacter sp.]
MPLEAHALEAFAALAERPGQAVAAQQLQQRSGGGTPVAREALWAAVASINRALAGCAASGYYVAQHPEDGFTLVWPAQTPGAAAPALVIGREEAIAHVASQLQERRFVTIVGAGGMGKTTVAKALARELAARYRDGIHFVDLAPLADSRRVANAVASALGFSLPANEPLASLAAFVRGKQMLVVLDSCEHIIESAAAVAEAILRAEEGIHVLSTSREPLLGWGEWLYRLSPMGLPEPGAVATVQEAMAHSAVQLFVDRAKLGGAGYALQSADVESVVLLCRRLDGIALAIEIAAARVTQLGIAGLATQLEEHLLLLGGPAREAPARHGTLSAMLDWSHELLSAPEKRVFRQLAVFRGNFTLDAATAVLASGDFAQDALGDVVLDLVEKSLLARQPGGGLRMLDTTRAYASAKLAASADGPAARRRHADFILGLLRDAQEEWEAMPPQQWLGRYASWIDDVRFVLEWSFAVGGDAPLGIALAFASFSLARQMSLDVEFKGYVERALVALEGQSPRDYLVEMTLKSYLGSMGQRISLQASPQSLSLEQILGRHGSEIGARDQIIALSSLNHGALMEADFAAATQWTRRAWEAACDCGDPVAVMIARRMQTQVLHFMGDHEGAQAMAREVLESSWRKIPLAYNPSPVEQRVSMRIVLARILWMQGFADQACAMAGDALGQAHTDTAIAQCQALAMCALPVALWNGRDGQCQALARDLEELARRHSLGYWQYWAERVQLVLALRAGGEGMAVDERLLRHGPVEANLRDHLCTFDERLLGADVVARMNQGKVGWCAPEILRTQAVSLTRGSASDTAGAEALLRQSIALARRQGALAWELRSATSLARLLGATGQARLARDQLAAVYAQFTEGFATADLQQAQATLADLQAA